jgi:hypothetical protein
MSGLNLRPILLLSSVCALLLVLNCDKFGIKCDKYSAKGFQGNVNVSSFQLPTRHDSALQNGKHPPIYNGVSQDLGCGLGLGCGLVCGPPILPLRVQIHEVF